MPGRHRILLPAGASLQDRLFELGVEFPCGGESQCGGCRIRVVEGEIPTTPDMRAVLTPGEIAAGWRLACQSVAHSPVTVEVGQWSPSILTDESAVAVEPRDGLGIVIDLGTTTLVAQLVDLATGEVLAVESALNPQARFGADIMSRVHFDLRSPGVLRASIRETLGRMVGALAVGRTIEEILLCGNTVMHHLFCGLDVAPLAAAPFRPETLGEFRFSNEELGWDVALRGGASFLPCLGGFVGSDILAGIVATGLHESNQPEALMDLGTNGEIAVHAAGRLLCASTAAGPAFEGGGIGMGMRAGAGAIDQVHLDGCSFVCHVLGGAAPAGLCGSGLVDAVAASLDLGLLGPSGKLRRGLTEIALEPPVVLTQRDVRELQLAKGAVAAGLAILLRMASTESPARLWLAGAFGNYVRVTSARRIGLLPGGSHIESTGNSALRGARALLLHPSVRASILQRVVSRCEHVELAADPSFQETFVESMLFPE